MVDWHDQEEVNKLKDKNDKQLKIILKKRIEAREKGDKVTMIATSKALSSFLAKNRSYEKMAEDAGVNWY